MSFNFNELKNSQVIFYLPNNEHLVMQKEGYVLDVYINKIFDENPGIISTSEFASIIYVDDNKNFKTINIPVTFIIGLYGNDKKNDKKNTILCDKCRVYYKPTTVAYYQSQARYICPECSHIIVIGANEEILRSFII